jgi:aryl-phospho-beta-D-glucosidase BglC (GH1 family)
MSLRAYFIVVFLCVLAAPGRAQDAASLPAERPWYQAPWTPPPPPPAGAETLPRLRVEGNRIVDAEGRPVLLRGASISDPDKLAGQGHWNKGHFEQVKKLGAGVVRIPVHPVAWRNRGPQEYVKLLDQAVAWCTELEMYAMIDWHSIGNLETELFQAPMYDTTKRETLEFWRAVARRYSVHNTVAFYEIFNEPTTFRGQLGDVRWSDWKATNQTIIRLIRSYGGEGVPIVAGFDWAYDLTPLLEDPLDLPGVAYAVHPYEHKRSKPWEPKWEEDFGFAAARFPLVATEFGFGGRPTPGGGAGAEYGEAIVNYLEAKNVSWVAWCFDPEWGPPLLKNWNYELAPSGEFFQSRMKTAGEKKSE